MNWRHSTPKGVECRQSPKIARLTNQDIAKNKPILWKKTTLNVKQLHFCDYIVKIIKVKVFQNDEHNNLLPAGNTPFRITPQVELVESVIITTISLAHHSIVSIGY